MAGRKNSSNKKNRDRIPAPKRKSLIEKNAGVCCICRQRGLGLEVHHLDMNPSNNSDDNLAVLCALDHDHSHRPLAYRRSHGDLDMETIKKRKIEWENFVLKARGKPPGVIALINWFGTGEEIHSMKLTIHDESKYIGIERVYHRHLQRSSRPELWIDLVKEELDWLGEDIKVTDIPFLEPVEDCPCCNSSYSRTIDPPYFQRLTSDDWHDKSIFDIYINPKKPYLLLTVAYVGDIKDPESISEYCVWIHKCGNFINLSDGKTNDASEITNRPSVRTQVTTIVKDIVENWEPGRVFIRTGDHDNIKFIQNLDLPVCWERGR